MKQHEKKPILRVGTIICIAAVLLILGCCIVSAAYINRNTVKRVVSTQSGSGTPFSSNYLVLTPKESSTYIMKNIFFPENASTIDFEINVCNYVQNDPSKVNENDISYTLTLTLLNAANGNAVTGSYPQLKVTDKNNITYPFSDGKCTIDNLTLTKKTKSVNTFSLTVPKEFVSSVNIKAEAIPSDNASYSAANGCKLGRIFTFSPYSASSMTWTGSFAETVSDNYDGFNYIIKGQGKGEVTLEWDPSQLEISKIFLDTNSLQDKITSSDSKKSITFEVDSATKSRYDIQFYKTENGVYTNMETVNGYVQVYFTVSDSNTAP